MPAASLRFLRWLRAHRSAARPFGCEGDANRPRDKEQQHDEHDDDEQHREQEQRRGRRRERENAPSHEIFLVEGEGKDTTWTKVGVAFPTKSGHSHRVFVGKKGDPKQKIYLVCPNSQFDHEDKSRPGEDAKRMPYANIFDTTGGGAIDFKKRDGVAFLNRDDSLTLLIGDQGDPEQLKSRCATRAASRSRAPLRRSRHERNDERRLSPSRRSSPLHMNIDEATCSICGREHDKDDSVDLDSTVLCPDCATMLQRSTSTTAARLERAEER